MAKYPYISVIVPVYNAANYLERCIDSIINQHYNDMELILVDDGSIDGSSEICDQYIDNGRCPVIALHKKNEGVAKARIDGYKISTGNYVMFVDSDDYLSENAIESMCDAISDTNIDLVVAQNYTVRREEIKLMSRAIKSGVYNKKEIHKMLETNFLYDTLTKKSGFPLFLWGKLYNREILNGTLEKGIGFWYGEDMVCLYHIMEKTNSMIVMKEPLYYYFQNEHQVTKKNIDILWPEYSKIWEYFYQNDDNSLFKYQLPERIWNFIRFTFNEYIWTRPKRDYNDAFMIVCKPQIVKDLVLSKKSVIRGRRNCFIKFLIRNGYNNILYYLIRHKVIDKFKNVIKMRLFF